MQTQIAQGGTFTLPLESALEGLKGPLEASLSVSPETPFRPPQKAFRLSTRKTFSHIFSSARGDDARRPS